MSQGNEEDSGEDPSISGQPPEDENDPKELHEERKLFSVRDNVQAWYETSFTSLIFTVLYSSLGLYLWGIVGIPFEAIVIVMLAHISSDTSALWRTYVR